MILGTCCVFQVGSEKLKSQWTVAFRLFSALSCKGTRVSSKLSFVLVAVMVSAFELSTLKRSFLWVSWLLVLLLPKPRLVFWRHTRQSADFDKWTLVIYWEHLGGLLSPFCISDLARSSRPRRVSCVPVLLPLSFTA